MEIGKTNRKHSGKSLRHLFIAYLIKVFLIFIAITAGYILLWVFGIMYKVFLPADYYLKKVDNYIEYIQNEDKFDTGIIPKEIKFAVFDKEKNILQTILTDDDMESVTAMLDESSQPGILSKYSNKKQIKILITSEKIYVFSYYILAEFSSECLRSIFPRIERIAIPVYVIIVLTGIFAESVKTAKQLSKKIRVMKQAADQIKARELEFDIAYTGIKELDTVMDSLGELRDDLRESLQNQWQMQQIQNEQMGAMAHDIKTPLTIIRGNAELLGETELDEEQSEYLGSISGNVERIQNYVVGLLEISKENDIEVHMEKIKVQSFVSEFIQQTEQLCKVKNTTVEFNCEPGDIEVEIDSEQCMRALINLVDNAVQYSVEGGKIYIGSYTDDDMWAVSVEDEGKGFSAEDLRYAKTRLYRAQNERSMDGHYGMGLYIVDQIAKKHYGELILSNGVNGAKVVFTVKIKQPI